jgi:hypothetical protein
MRNCFKGNEKRMRIKRTRQSLVHDYPFLILDHNTTLRVANEDVVHCALLADWDHFMARKSLQSNGNDLFK